MDVISRRLGRLERDPVRLLPFQRRISTKRPCAPPVEAPGDRIMGLLDPELDNLRGVLERFTDAYLDFILGKEVLALSRTAVSEGRQHTARCPPVRAGVGACCHLVRQVLRGADKARPHAAGVAPRHVRSLQGFDRERLSGVRALWGGATDGQGSRGTERGGRVPPGLCDRAAVMTSPVQFQQSRPRRTPPSRGDDRMSDQLRR